MITVHELWEGSQSMDKERRQQFWEEYLKMNDAMARPGMFDRDEVVKHLTEICRILRVCKSVTDFIKIRPWKSLAVIIGTIYGKIDEPEYSAEEMYNIK